MPGHKHIEFNDRIDNVRHVNDDAYNVNGWLTRSILAID